MNELYIIGTGSQARYVIEICKSHKIKGLIDILDKNNVGKVINGVEVICHLDEIDRNLDPRSLEIIIAYGNNKKKEEIVKELSKKNYKFATMVSERAYVSSNTEIGHGCIINPNVTIMPNAKIGNHVIIHSGSVIEHDNEIGDYANISPGVVTAGYVKIGKGSYVYTRAAIIPRVKIGENVTVGAGAVVLNDVQDNSVVVGVPAKPIKKTNNGE